MPVWLYFLSRVTSMDTNGLDFLMKSCSSCWFLSTSVLDRFSLMLRNLSKSFSAFSIDSALWLWFLSESRPSPSACLIDCKALSTALGSALAGDCMLITLLSALSCGVVGACFASLVFFSPKLILTFESDSVDGAAAALLAAVAAAAAAAACSAAFCFSASAFCFSSSAAFCAAAAFLAASAASSASFSCDARKAAAAAAAAASSAFCFSAAALRAAASALRRAASSFSFFLRAASAAFRSAAAFSRFLWMNPGLRSS
mmetsp:Transcript_29216/g.40479  ORF Transcript_29216/g.40479 Transcript_29216/m.40479 type:complete len:258 (+) Transcript_29216:255-1028(+)